MPTQTRLTDEEYDFIFERVPRLCVDIAIKTDDGILLSFRDIEPCKNMWHMPGGMVKRHESLLEAINRIAKKETGLEVEIIQSLGYIEFLHEIQNNKDRHSVSIVFLVRFVQGTIQPDFQSTKIKAFKTMPDQMHQTHQEFLKKYWQKIAE